MIPHPSPTHPHLSLPTLTLLIILTFTLTLGACTSAKQNILTHTSRVGDLARASTSLFTSISSETQSPSPSLSLINDKATQGVSQQKEIVALTESVLQDTAHVQDIPSVFSRILHTLTILGVAAVSIAVLFFLWQTGLGFLLKRLFHSFGLFLPRHVVRDVDFDMDELSSPAASPTRREAVAARRASDHAYNKAWALERQRRLSSRKPPPLPPPPPTPTPTGASD